jgi:dipeptidyl aminopeptidase/acylaminoacyl peptidase
VAFDPRSDVEGNFNFAQKIMLRGGGISWLDEFFTAYNPKNHAAELRGPVFLFHARDDTVVPVSETEAFAAELQRLGKRVNLVTVPTGGHYEGMIAQGVPRAIEWLRGVDTGR